MNSREVSTKVTLVTQYNFSQHTNNSLFLNFGWLALPNDAENNLINFVYEGLRYGQ